ncbi:MAG: hypothetical protein R3265_17430 [Hyphomonas sp.]|nr:hypothetical protein [Hyphomonas sp.]
MARNAREFRDLPVPLLFLDTVAHYRAGKFNIRIWLHGSALDA